jgi:hypothetical protein
MVSLKIKDTSIKSKVVASKLMKAVEITFPFSFSLVKNLKKAVSIP